MHELTCVLADITSSPPISIVFHKRSKAHLTYWDVSQIGLWAFGALAHGKLLEVCRVAGCIFLAAVSVAAALGFLVYGGRLFLMLQRFPIESRGRTKKLREVSAMSYVSGIQL